MAISALNLLRLYGTLVENKSRGVLADGGGPLCYCSLPAGHLRRGRHMGIRTGQQDLSGCATKEELATLIDNAFAVWQSGGPKPDDNRDTPRIPGGEAKPLFVVSYTYNGQEVRLNRRTDIVDISADGLGVGMAEPLPVGATLRFAFDGQDGERNFGMATVVRLTKAEGGYRIGLTFAKDAKSLDVEPSPDGAETHFKPTSRWRRQFNQLKETITAGCRMFTQRLLAGQKAGKMR